jgi:hypothetical protein
MSPPVWASIRVTLESPAAINPRWWLWPTILSLDAPLVVLLWQALLARTASVSLGGAERTVLGASVWLAYAADRWIEGWRLEPSRIQTHRHLFYQRLRWPIAAAWVLVLSLDIATAVRALSPREIEAGVLLLVPVAAYLLSHQFVHRHRPLRPPKEACVALLLGAGAGIFVLGRPGAGPAAAPLALFVLLCFSNCAFISVWEDEVDRVHGQTSLALQFRSAAGPIRALPWVLAAVAAAVWTWGGGPQEAPAACAGASAALLLLVDRAEPRIGRIPARVLADAALMTPIVPLLLRGAL